jgi:hypothetical protein
MGQYDAAPTGESVVGENYFMNVVVFPKITREANYFERF